MNKKKQKKSTLQLNQLLIVIISTIGLAFILAMGKSIVYDQRSKAQVTPTNVFQTAGSFRANTQSSVEITKTHTLGKFENVTIESLFRFVPTTTPQQYYPIISKRMPFPGAGTAYELNLTSDRKISFIYSILYRGEWQPVELLSNTTVSANTWNHVAVVYNNIPGSVDAGKLTLFINGQPDKSIVQTGSIGGGSETDFGSNVRIGVDLSGNSFFNGEIDEVRISTLPRYLSNGRFDIAQPFIFDTSTSLLLHFNDQLPNPIAESILPGISTSGIALSYLTNIFAGFSVQVPTPTPAANAGWASKIAQGQYYELSNSPLKLENDFTFETWVKLDDIDGLPGGSRTVFGQYGQTAGSPNFWVQLLSNTTTKEASVNFIFMGRGNVGTQRIRHNEWHHIAAVKTGNTIKGFIDGQEVVSNPIEPLRSQLNPITTIGAWRTPTFKNYHLNGSLDELRLSNVARPVASLWQQGAYHRQFMTDKGTVFLMHFENNAVANGMVLTTKVTPVGNPTYTQGIVGMGTMATPAVRR